MKLVRKNDEFIVIESRGSYHKVALEEIDALIVLLCEAKAVDPAKANKSIGENLFEGQERTTRVFGPYIDALHRDYVRAKQSMGLSMAEIKERLRLAGGKQRDEEEWVEDAWEEDCDDREYLNPLDFGNKHFNVPGELLLENKLEPHAWIPPLTDKDILAPTFVITPTDEVRIKTREWLAANMRSPADFILGVDPATKEGDMTMTITKGRQFTGKTEKLSPLNQAIIDTFTEKMPGRINTSPYLYDNPKKPGIGMFEDLFIPRQNYKSNLRMMIEQMAWWQGPKGSPLRNPLLGEKRIGQSERPRVAPQYRTLRTAYRERMARIAEGQYVAAAFPKRFDRQHHKLPGTLYTSDIGYYVLTGNLDEDVKSLAEIKSKAVKAWEC